MPGTWWSFWGERIEAYWGDIDGPETVSALERAIAFAVAGHAGQRDKAGAPYILHPLRLMLSMPDDETRIVAVLHDVVEDTPATFADLERLDLPPASLRAIRLLTHAPEVAYLDYVRGLLGDPIARAVKRADLMDNLDLGRLAAVTARDEERIERYRQALALLDGAAPVASGRGDFGRPPLRFEAKLMLG